MVENEQELESSSKMSDGVAEVDSSMLNEKRVRDYRSFMIKLGSEMKSDDLSKLKYFLKGKIPAGKMEGLNKPLDLFSELEDRAVIGAGKLDKLRSYLEGIDRPSLISMVDEFDDSNSAFPLKAKSQNYLINSWKPLGMRGKNPFEYGIEDGSQVDVNLGGKGGVSFSSAPASEKRVVSTKDAKWRAGASALGDESQQKFVMKEVFPLESALAVSLNLRLVAREDVRCLPSTGECTPLARATLIPPPVPA